MDILTGITPSSQKLTPLAAKDEAPPNDDFNALLANSMSEAKTATPTTTDSDKPAPESRVAPETVATPITDNSSQTILSMLTQINAYQANTTAKDSLSTPSDQSLKGGWRASPAITMTVATAILPSGSAKDFAKPAPPPSTEPSHPALTLDTLKVQLKKTSLANAVDTATTTTVASVANAASETLTSTLLTVALKPVMDVPPAAVAQASVTTPFGKGDWTQAVAQQVMVMVKDKIQTLSLALNPPNLGPLHVVVEIKSQVANVMFFSAAPQVQQALREGLPVLQDMLGQAGVALGQTDIGYQQQQRGQKNNPAKTNQSSANPEEELITSTHNAQTDPSHRQGLVNLYA